MLFSAFGFGYFMYGRKQQKTVALLSGIGLMVLPYFIDGNTMLALCFALIVAPFVVRQ